MRAGRCSRGELRGMKREGGLKRLAGSDLHGRLTPAMVRADTSIRADPLVGVRICIDLPGDLI